MKAGQSADAGGARKGGPTSLARGEMVLAKLPGRRCPPSEL